MFEDPSFSHSAEPQQTNSSTRQLSSTVTNFPVPNEDDPDLGEGSCAGG